MTADYNENLNQFEAKHRLVKYGKNILPEKKPPSVAVVFLRQFKSPFIYVLLIATVVSFILGHIINSIFILVVLIINALIGTIQEYSAEQAATALKKWSPPLPRLFAIIIRIK